MSDRPDPASDAPTLPPDRPADDTATIPPSRSGRPAPTADPIPGYDILGELGRGGMGVVYRARDTRLNRTVALKMVLAGAHADPRELVRFLAEAEAVAAVEHPHVVRVFGYGEHDGRPYMALEFCDGGSLAGRIGRAGRLSPTDAAGVVAAVARGVQAAHDLGIVHRDIKPANVLLTADGSPKVTDFGLAKRGGGAGLTQTNAVMGTPAYMAPEQAKGLTKFVGPAADVYALGVILYECLAGRPPFEADDTIALIMKVVEESPPPLSRFTPAVPWDLDVIARKCLAKEPRERYPTAAALADDLDRWVQGEPISARSTTATQRAWMWVRRNKTVAGLVAGLVFAMIAGTIVSVFYGVKAGINERQAWDNLNDAVDATHAAKAAEGRAKDALLRGRFEEAKAVRLARQTGWRDKVLTLLGESAALRWDRTGPPPDGLPSLAELRGEAVMALIQRDANLVRELPANTILPTRFTADGRQMFQREFRTDQDRFAFVTTDLTTGRKEETPKDATPEHLAALDWGVLNTDGSRILSVTEGQGTFQIRELKSGRILATLPASNDILGTPVNARPLTYRGRFSPDGRQVLAVRFAKQTAEVVVWDAEKLTPPRMVATVDIPPTQKAIEQDLWGDTRIFPSLRFSPDGSRVSFLTQDKTAVRVVDLTADPPVATDIPTPSPAVVAEWHPTDSRLAVVVRGEKKSLRVVLCDVTPKTAFTACDGEFESLLEDSVLSPVFSSDGRRLAFTSVGGRAAHVFDTRTGVEVFRISDATAGMGLSHLFWAADGTLATCGTMETLRFWKVADDPPVEGYDRLRAVDRPVISPDGTRIAVYAPSGRGRSDVKGGAEVVADRSPATRYRDRVAVLDRRTGEVERFLDAFDDEYVGGLQFSRDGKNVVLLRPAELLVREVATGKEVVRRAVPKAAGGEQWMRAFSTAGGTLVGTFQAKQGKGSVVRLWDVTADRPAFPGTDLHRFLPPLTGVNMEGLLVAPQGNHGLIPAPPQLANPLTKERTDHPPSRLFELPSGKLLAEYEAAVGPRDYAWTFRLGPDARRSLTLNTPIDTGGGGVSMKAAVWVVHEVPAGTETLRIPATAFSWSESVCDFSPDGRSVAVGTSQGFVEVWDIDAKELVFRWQPHGGKMVTGLTFSPEGDIATVSDEDHRLCVLKMRDLREKLTKLGLGW